MLDGWKRMIASGVGLLIMAGQQAGFIPIDANTEEIVNAVILLAILGLSIKAKVQTPK
jgi:hypothetical protein